MIRINLKNYNCYTRKLNNKKILLRNNKKIQVVKILKSIN